MGADVRFATGRTHDEIVTRARAGLAFCTFTAYDRAEGTGARMALNRADAEVIEQLVNRLRAEHDERAAVVVERLLQQALVSPDPRTALAGYMTTGEAARLIGVSAQTVKNWVAQGRLVGSRVGGRTLVTRRSVQSFFDSLGTAPQPTGEEDDVERAEAEDRELMESLPAGLPERVEALLDRQRAGDELSASERNELRQLAQVATAAATRRARSSRHVTAAAPSGRWFQQQPCACSSGGRGRAASTVACVAGR